MEKKIKILGVGSTNATEDEVLQYLIKNVQKTGKKLFLTTINAEILVASYKNPDYRKVLNSSDLALPDTIGVTLGARILGKPLKDRIPGTDFVENICREVSKRPITVGLLGGRQNVAEKAAECLKNRYPGLKIAFAKEDWPQNETLSKSLKCDILFVAYGAPKQEFWIEKNLKNINVSVAMGVGGALDFISGGVPRAPKVVRTLGFEWLFRLIVQPWRIRRQVSLIYFVLLILKEKISRHKN